MAEDDGKNKKRKVTVRVQPGDNLRTIAEKVLGDPSRWKELRDLGYKGQDLEVGQKLKIPRKMVSQQFLRRRFARRAMNADEEYQRVRRANDLDRERYTRDIEHTRSQTNREIQRTYEAYLLERDRQLLSTRREWNARGVGMSGGVERDVAETQSLLDTDRKEWETQINDDARDAIRVLRDERQDVNLATAEARKEARERAGQRWNERKARERAVARGLV